jgi:hypothetical protein
MGAWLHGRRRTKGATRSKQEGEMLALQKQLAKRFGAIPANITALIANASVQDIESWFDQAIDAKGLSDIFTDAL